VHCHNEPDVLTVAALAGDAPVVHDTHDLISLRANNDANLSYFEGIANRGAAGRVYTTSYQMEEASKLYGTNGPSLVFCNYVSEADLPKKFLPKLSEQDGKIHIVYEGGIGGKGHRDFSSQFVDLANRGFHVHIYPTGYNEEIARYFSTFKTIHYYEPLSPKQIIEEMTQYDFGIIPFNLKKGNKRFLDSTIANKLFEYMAARLPVIASSLHSYVEYFENNPVGITFSTVDDIVEGIPRLKEIRSKVDFSANIFTYEKEITKIEQFYYSILSKKSSSSLNDPHLRRNQLVRQQKDSTFYDQLYLSGGWRKEYHKHYTERVDHRSWKKALQWIKLKSQPKIIEIGCGTGQFANMIFDNHISNYHGIDFSPIAIRMAKKINSNYSNNFKIDNALTSNIYTSDYNIAVLFEVLEHVDADLRILDNIKDNCTVIFSVPNFDSASHVRWFNTRNAILARYGDLVDIEDIYEIELKPTLNKIYLAKAVKKPNSSGLGPL
jgi:2-polyprenyl-3-methyl-5-hydroxy-6-metoxy-1,4-benzoquinol methylase